MPLITRQTARRSNAQLMLGVRAPRWRFKLNRRAGRHAIYPLACR